MSLFRLLASAAPAALLAAAALPAPAAAELAGNVEFAIGDVTAFLPAEPPRAIDRGDPVDGGDTIRTDADGRAQLRFLDGGFLSLSENTEFRVDDYFFATGDTDGSAKFTLVSGAMRAVTGLIGRTDKDDYRIDTPVGSIGIRGTGYTATMGDGLTVSVGEGAVVLQNDAGRLLITQGQTGFMADRSTPPALVAAKPYVPPPQPVQKKADTEASEPSEQPRYAEQRQEDGRLAGTVLPAVQTYHDDHGDVYYFSGTLATSPYKYIMWTGSLVDQHFDIAESTTFDGSNRLLGYRSYTDPAEAPERGTMTASEVYSTDYIQIGRWSNGTTGGTFADLPPPPLSADQGLHYVLAVPAADLPTTGIATYSLTGATKPTFGDGGTAPGTFSGSLGIDFATGALGYSFAVSMPSDHTYTFGTPGGAANPNNGGGYVSGPFFWHSTTVASGGRACASGCDAEVFGTLSGPNGQNAGLIYNISPGYYDDPLAIDGAALFTKN